MSSKYPTTGLSVPPRRKTVGRQPLISEAIVERIVSIVRAGNYQVTACRAVGIAETTFYEWVARGQVDITQGDPDSLYAKLVDGLNQGEAEAEAEMVARVKAATEPGIKSRLTKIDAAGRETVEIRESAGDWLPAATLLERRHPDRWGRRERKTIDINESKRITITRVEIVLDEGDSTAHISPQPQPPVIEP